MTKPSYPSPSHALKSVTRGRIKRGSKRLKTPPNSHVVERAVRIGESQQTRRSGKRASAAREPTPAPPPPEGGGEEGASPHATDKCPEALPPPSPDQGRAGGEEAPHKKTLGAPRDPPLFPAHLKGGKKKKKKTQEAKLPKKFPRKGKSKAQKEQSLKGEKMSYTKRTLPQFPLSQRPKAQDTTWH